jgi:hypothetical protein
MFPLDIVERIRTIRRYEAFMSQPVDGFCFSCVFSGFSAIVKAGYLFVVCTSYLAGWGGPAGPKNKTRRAGCPRASSPWVCWVWFRLWPLVAAPAVLAATVAWKKRSYLSNLIPSWLSPFTPANTSNNRWGWAAPAPVRTAPIHLEGAA